MSRSPYIYIEIHNNKTDKWEKVVVQSNRPNFKGERKLTEIDVWPWNASHELFSILENRVDGNIPEFVGIKSVIPKNASEEIANEWNKIVEKSKNDSFSYLPNCFYFTIADAKVYLYENTFVKDWDSEEEDAIKLNPLYELVERVMDIVSIWNCDWDFDYLYSDMRVIGWIW